MRAMTGRPRGARDSGSALVAAMAVAIIGIALTTIVVTQVIIVTNDSARDRVRTAEVHSAEQGLDVTLQLLESTLPCDAPAGSPFEVGGGTTATNVAVSIEYFDIDGDQLTSCAGGTISGAAAQAVVTSTATPVNAAPGIDPVRSIEATVNLEPVAEATSGAAIFSAGSFSTGAGFDLVPADPEDRASVWIDSGNWSCSTSVGIDGDIVVADGRLTLSQSNCFVTGDAWARDGYTSCCTPSVPWHIGGSLTVFDGNVTVDYPTRIGGDVSVGGNITQPSDPWWDTPWERSTIGGSQCADNVNGGCGELPEYTPRGLPEVDYKPDDWDGFSVRQQEHLGERIIDSWNLTAGSWQANSIESNFNESGQPSCQIPGWMSNQPLEMPGTPTIYDLRACDNGDPEACNNGDLRACDNGFDANGGTVTLELYADTAFFAPKFAVSNGLVIKSGDGDPHKVWLIVPEGGTPDNGIAEDSCRSNTPEAGMQYCPGNIQFSSNAINIQEPISSYMYTPRELQFNNSSVTRGQMYGGSINVGQGNGEFQYVGIGVPGVDLNNSESSSAGFTVEIVNKREVRE